MIVLTFSCWVANYHKHGNLRLPRFIITQCLWVSLVQVHWVLFQYHETEVKSAGVYVIWGLLRLTGCWQN